jgi:hypothetical protein
MRQVLLPNVVVLEAVAGLRADVVDEKLQVHLGLAAQTLDIRHKVALIGADGAAQGVIIFKRGREAERKNGRPVKAAGDHSSVIAGCGLRFRADQATAILGEVLGDNNGEIRGRKQEYLVSKKAGYPRQRHRTAMTS